MKNTQKLNISFVYDDSMDGSEGVAQYVKTLGAWLSAKGHNVTYLAGESKIKHYKNGKVYSLAKNVPVKFNGNKLSIPLPTSKSGIKNALAEAHPDVLHIQVPYSPFMAQLVINCAGPATAVIGTFHIFPAGKLSKFGTHLLKYLYGRSLKKFDEIFSVSQPAQEFAKASLGINSQIIPNMVEVARFKSSGTFDSNSIVFLGRLVERKGCSYLIKAFAKVLSLHPQLKLCIAGDGPERASLEALCTQLGISDSVKFLGFVTETEKARLLNGAAIACFPSLYGESFGIVLVEAMAAGSGVVLAGDNPGYTSVMNSDARVLFDPKNIDQLALTISEIIDDTEYAKQLHKQQQQLVDKYDVENVAPQILEYYYQLIAKKSANRHN